MLKYYAAFILSLLLFALPGTAAAQSSTANPAVVQAQLDEFVAQFLQTCNTQIRPCKASPELSPRNGKVVSTYLEVDPSNVKAELYPGSGKGFSYLAKLTYVEHTYEAVGANAEEALNGVYMRVKSRRVTELPRYVRGVWQN